MPSIIRCTIAVVCASISLNATAEPFPCPTSSAQIATNIKADVNGSAQTLLRIGSAEVKGQVEKTAVDLYSKYPNADRVAIISNLVSTACNLIVNSKQMSDEQKFDKWLLIFPYVKSLLNKENDTIKEKATADDSSHPSRAPKYNEREADKSTPYPPRRAPPPVFVDKNISKEKYVDPFGEDPGQLYQDQNGGLWVRRNGRYVPWDSPVK